MRTVKVWSGVSVREVKGNQAGHWALERAFQRRSVLKEYLSIGQGKLVPGKRREGWA